MNNMPESYIQDRVLWYSPRYLQFCQDANGSGQGEHHIVLRADGGGDEDFNVCSISIDNHKRAHEILYEDNCYSDSMDARKLSQRAYSVTRGLGHEATDETKQRMRKAKLGKPHYQSPETIRKIAISNTGKIQSEERKQNTARIVTELWKNEEYRAHMVQKLKSRKEKLWKRVCRTCGQEFESHACNARYCPSCKKGG